MKHKFQEDTGYLLIHMPREVDHHTSLQLREEADFLLRRYPVRGIVFDFQETVFMDSSGIGVILGRCRNVSLAGGQALAVHLNEQVKKIFCMSGLQKVISIEA
ncbi:MAG: anti-sigma factor antagonist [Lachnospiraceae bacterium]|jgi:stage II sporulation protein AA (anti-sigma F factor antagonist)|nr:anti-sigma factor antagonist [Lachnospiraceae bacterium]MCI9151347.1 anti-sigma factor antagonist [Lachnospiraceae bacterium]